jgi:nucleotide-binding universal stress UspA family protein
MLMLSQAARGLLTPASSTPVFIVALSGERRDTVVLRLVASLARSIGGHVMAVCSTSDLAWHRAPGEWGVNVSHEQVGARVTSYLESVRNELLNGDVAAWTAIVDGEFASEIARLPREEGELIVLGSHGSPLRRQAAAEGAMALVRTTGSAVLLVPEDPLLTVLEGGQCTRTPGGDLR